MRALVTGATGYIGGRLIPRLLARGHQVRVLVRDPARIQGRPWTSRVEVCLGDLLRPESLGPALEGVDAAYYLVHCMLAGENFDEMDRQAARNFVEAGRRQRLGLAIYLGGLLPKTERASEHLRSRAQVGEILRAGLPTTEFRAGPVVGSGSASFEMVRYLSERIPILFAPPGIRNPVQPIAVGDVLDYLVGALDRPAAGAVDIGAEPVSFRGMLDIYLEARRLRRRLYETALLRPSLCAKGVGLLTPIPTSLAAPLLEGIAHPVLADTVRARALYPEISPIGYREAVERALAKISQNNVETRWSGALGVLQSGKRTDWEGLYEEQCSLLVQASPQAVYGRFCTLGGERGWVAWTFFWRLRGAIDRLVGGPGLQRGRRHPTQLLPGEALDVWRVEVAQPPRLLRLRAEMKVPGEAWLQFEAIPEGRATRLVITALMEPYGVPGWLYWWGSYPFHRFGFRRLAKELAREAEACET